MCVNKLNWTGIIITKAFLELQQAFRKVVKRERNLLQHIQPISNEGHPRRPRGGELGHEKRRRKFSGQESSWDATL